MCRELELSKKVVEICEKENLTTFQAIRKVEEEEKENKSKTIKLFEDVNLNFTEKEIKVFKHSCQKRTNMRKMAFYMGRTRYEIILLALHLQHIGEIGDIPFWIFEK